MTLSLDHVVIAVTDLEQAMADYRDLGFTVVYGGRHASGTTHNALICFRDGTYLELLAPTGEQSADPGAVDFSHLLQYGEGVVGYAFVSDDLETDAAVLRSRGINVGEVKEGGRRRDDGVELRWKTALIDGGMSPFLIEDITPRYQRVPDDEATTTHANAAGGISSFVVRLHQVTSDRLDWYTRLFGVPPQQDNRSGRFSFPLRPTHFVFEPASDDEAEATLCKLVLAEIVSTTLDLEKMHNVVFA